MGRAARRVATSQRPGKNGQAGNEDWSRVRKSFAAAARLASGRHGDVADPKTILPRLPAHAPFAELVKLSPLNIADEMREDHRRRMLGNDGWGDCRVASILPFVRLRSDFPDDVTRIMGEAFDAACKELHDTGQPPIVQEIIAKRIIAAAQTGERDVTRLRDVALEALGHTPK